MAEDYEHVRKNCPECGEVVEARYVRVGHMYRIPAMQVRTGPEHARRCRHYAAPRTSHTEGGDAG